MGAPKPATYMVCRNCDSQNVVRDAYAKWDSEDGEWVIHSVYDDACCLDCEYAGSNVIKEVTF